MPEFEYNLSMLGTSFSSLLYREMTAQGLKCQQVVDLLNEQGVTDISHRRISDYRRGSHVPSLERAKAIVKALGLEISEEDILQMLANDKKDRTSENERSTSIYSKEINKGLRIKMKDLLPDFSEEATYDLLERRITMLCGDPSRFRIYVQGLIAKDLNEYIMSEEDYK